MKVGLIGFSIRNYIPYIEHYEDVFKNNDIKYECIFWIDLLIVIQKKPIMNILYI